MGAHGVAGDGRTWGGGRWAHMGWIVALGVLWPELRAYQEGIVTSMRRQTAGGERGTTGQEAHSIQRLSQRWTCATLYTGPIATGLCTANVASAASASARRRRAMTASMRFIAASVARAGRPVES